MNAKVLAVIEKYPELKSNESFLALHKSLAQTETRIALARNYYNDVVTAYNTRRETFPESVFAFFAAMRKAKYLVLEDFEPKVGQEYLRKTPLTGETEEEKNGNRSRKV